MQFETQDASVPGVDWSDESNHPISLRQACAPEILSLT